MKYSTTTGKIVSETGWNGSYQSNQTGGPWGGGGGVSQLEGSTEFEQRWLGYFGNRMVPDVAYNGDPYTGVSIYFTDPTSSVGLWYVSGGTSAGAPQWAALMAKNNFVVTATAGTGAPGGYYPSQVTAMSYLYYNYSAVNGGATPIFGNTRDIISGDNGIWGAAAGYDCATGLGSPNGVHFNLPANTVFPYPGVPTGGGWHFWANTNSYARRWRSINS
jgi:subtilase family serine protease